MRRFYQNKQTLKLVTIIKEIDGKGMHESIVQVEYWQSGHRCYFGIADFERIFVKVE